MIDMCSHRWGESLYVDRVWSQVVGRAPSLAGERFLMVWQAWIDESYDEDSFVIAGFGGPASMWADFSRDWEELLPLAPVGKSGKHRLKMSEMAYNEDRHSDLAAFWRVIEKHMPVAMSVAVDRKAFHDVKNNYEAVSPSGPIDISSIFESEYYFAFGSFVNRFTNMRKKFGSKFIPNDAKIDFIFDDGVDKNKVFKSWDRAFIDEDTGRTVSSPPRFEDDEEFLPLQAADMIAWIARYGHSTGQLIVPWEQKKPLNWDGASIGHHAILQTTINALKATHIPDIVLRRID